MKFKFFTTMNIACLQCLNGLPTWCIKSWCSFFLPEEKKIQEKEEDCQGWSQRKKKGTVSCTEFYYGVKNISIINLNILNTGFTPKRVSTRGSKDTFLILPSYLNNEYLWKIILILCTHNNL